VTMFIPDSSARSADYSVNLKERFSDEEIPLMKEMSHFSTRVLMSGSAIISSAPQIYRAWPEYTV